MSQKQTILETSEMEKTTKTYKHNPFINLHYFQSYVEDNRFSSFYIVHGGGMEYEHHHRISIQMAEWWLSLMRNIRKKNKGSGGKECSRQKTWKQKSSDLFHRERTFFQGTAVVWVWDKFFQHFYLHVPRQLGASVLSAEPALGT